jgi:hypothetical protein
MFPNPDFGTVRLYVPVEFELQYITIDTQSTAVLIPVSIWLFGSGILGLVVITSGKIAASLMLSERNQMVVLKKD